MIIVDPCARYIMTKTVNMCALCNVHVYWSNFSFELTKKMIYEYITRTQFGPNALNLKNATFNSISDNSSREAVIKDAIF